MPPSLTNNVGHVLSLWDALILLPALYATTQSGTVGHPPGQNTERAPHMACYGHNRAPITNTEGPCPQGQMPCLPHLPPYSSTPVYDIKQPSCHLDQR